MINNLINKLGKAGFKQNKRNSTKDEIKENLLLKLNKLNGSDNFNLIKEEISLFFEEKYESDILIFNNAFKNKFDSKYILDLKDLENNDIGLIVLNEKKELFTDKIVILLNGIPIINIVNINIGLNEFFEKSIENNFFTLNKNEKIIFIIEEQLYMYHNFNKENSNVVNFGQNLKPISLDHSDHQKDFNELLIELLKYLSPKLLENFEEFSFSITRMFSCKLLRSSLKDDIKIIKNNIDILTVNKDYKKLEKIKKMILLFLWTLNMTLNICYRRIIEIYLRKELVEFLQIYKLDDICQEEGKLQKLFNGLSFNLHGGSSNFKNKEIKYEQNNEEKNYRNSSENLQCFSEFENIFLNNNNKLKEFNELYSKLKTEYEVTKDLIHEMIIKCNHSNN